LLADGGVVAILGQVFARSVLHEAVFAVNVEAGVLWGDILANTPSLLRGLKERWRLGVWSDHLEGVFLFLGLLSFHVQDNVVLNLVLCLTRFPLAANQCGGKSYGRQGCQAENGEDHSL
jgi:hypothetical protein